MMNMLDYDSADYYEHYRILPDGIFLACYRTIFGNGRLVISRNRYDMDIEGSWCYPSMQDAIQAMIDWQNPAIDARPPDGWFREVHTGQRRQDGDPEKECFQE